MVREQLRDNPRVFMDREARLAASENYDHNRDYDRGRDYDNR
jgi:hypothetical protein